MTGCDIAEALFGAFQAGDEETARALCDPQLRAIQNHAPAMSLDQLLAFSMSVTNLVKDFHYADVIRTEIPSGFIEEHSVRGTLPDGKTFALAACVVGTLREGKIVELREYVDSAAAMGLVRALSGS